MTLEDGNHSPETNPNAEAPKRRGRPPKDATAPKPASAPGAASTSAKALTAMPVQESRWGRIDLSEQVVATLGAGRYAATIADARIVENDTALFLRVTYEVTNGDGEVISPDDQWLTLFSADPAAAARVRDGRVALTRIATAVADQGITIGGDPLEIASALAGASVTVTVAVQGQGVGRKNVVRSVSAPVKG
jgi:hypothetical protein